jgi:transcriptional regulator with XRE-family HTH domain
MASNPRKTSVHETSKPNCGQKIFALRTDLKMNQAELGKRVGASAMSISRWESNSQQPPAHYLIKFGRLANPDECWFFWGEAGLTVADVMRVLPPSKRVRS